MWNKDQTGAGPIRQHTDLTYDVDGSLKGETVEITRPSASGSGDTEGTSEISYDLAGRLISWKSPFQGSGSSPVPPQRKHAYTVDDAGNVTQQRVTEGSTEVKLVTSNYERNQLRMQTTEESGSVTLEPFYNRLGEEDRREVSSAGQSLISKTEYDAAGHAELAGTDDEKTGYLYSADDQLLGRRRFTGLDQDVVDRAKSRLFFYFAGSANMAEEVDGNGYTKVTYFNTSSGQVIAEDRTSDWVWLLRDVKGNVATRMVGTDIRSQQAYDPYGAEDLRGTSFKDDITTERSSFGFQGAYMDEDSGNLLLGPRLYDPQTNRFTTADYFVGATSDMQLGTDPLTGNRYLFAGANPVAFYDDGHRPTSGGGGSGGGGPIAAAVLALIHRTGHIVHHYGEKLFHAPEGLLRYWEQRGGSAAQVLNQKKEQLLDAADKVAGEGYLRPREQLSANRFAEFLGSEEWESLGIRELTEQNGPDLQDIHGKTYDLIGGPASAENWYRDGGQSFLDSLASHSLKADVVPVDLTGFSESQIAQINERLTGLEHARHEKYIFFGD